MKANKWQWTNDSEQMKPNDLFFLFQFKYISVWVMTVDQSIKLPQKNPPLTWPHQPLGEFVRVISILHDDETKIEAIRQIEQMIRLLFRPLLIVKMLFQGNCHGYIVICRRLTMLICHHYIVIFPSSVFSTTRRWRFLFFSLL